MEPRFYNAVFESPIQSVSFKRKILLKVAPMVAWRRATVNVVIRRCVKAGCFLSRISVINLFYEITENRNLQKELSSCC